MNLYEHSKDGCTYGALDDQILRDINQEVEPTQDSDKEGEIKIFKQDPIEVRDRNVKSNQ